MGIVYLAHDPRLDRQVALKVTPPDIAKDKVKLARFTREARILAALDHPSISAIHGVEESEGKKYLVLELLRSVARGGEKPELRTGRHVRAHERNRHAQHEVDRDDDIAQVETVGGQERGAGQHRPGLDVRDAGTNAERTEAGVGEHAEVVAEETVRKLL